MRKLLLSIVICSLVFTCFTISETKASSNQKFNDLSSNHRFYEEIFYLVNKDIISGFPDKSFRSDQYVTREQAAIMIGRSLHLDGSKRTTKFKDVPVDSVASGYIASAVEKGIINGFPDDTFKPTQPVTRGQMAILLDQAFQLKKWER